jgi:hypothetical protein
MSNAMPDLAAFQREYEEKKQSFKTFHGAPKEVKFELGARFYKDEKGVVMFSYRADVASEFVRKVTDADKKQYPEEWKAFVGLKPRKD